MPAPKGHRPPNAGIGRKKGVPNKLPTAAKAALAEAFEGIGGVPSLIEWGQHPDHRAAFYALWGRLIPHEHTGEGGGPIKTMAVHDHFDGPVKPSA